MVLFIVGWFVIAAIVLWFLSRLFAINQYEEQDENDDDMDNGAAMGMGGAA